MAVPLMDPHSQYADGARADRASDRRRHRLGALHPRAARRRGREGLRRTRRRRARHRRGQRHRRPRDRAARARRGARRRGHLPLVHVLRDGRVDRRDRRRAGLRRHRGRDLQPRSGRGRGRDHAAHPRHRAGAPVRPPGRHGAAHGDREAARAAGARGCRAGVRRGARRRALRRDRRRRDVLVLPHQEPALLRRRRPHHDGERRGRPHVPRAALPRLRGQEDVHARRLQLAPRRAAGGHPAPAAAARRRLERRPHRRRRRLRGARPRRARRAAGGRPGRAPHLPPLHRAQPGARAPDGRAVRGGHRERDVLHDAAPPAAGLRAPRPPRRARSP